MPEYDFILKGGHILDPKNGIDAKRDLAVRGGRIAAVEENLSGSSAERVYSAEGLFVTPGLIDAHVHCYHSSGIPRAWAGDLSLQPDYHSFRMGATTWIDTGSAGSYQMRHFKATVIDRSQTRILAYMNIADYGMTSLLAEQFPERNDRESLLSCYEELKDHLVGLKVAHYDNPDWKDIAYAKDVREALGVPIMVDFGVFRKERPYEELVSGHLEPGDISTHCFRGPVPVLDENQRVYDYLWRAKERGVKFDLGHGAGSFVFRNALPALRQGFYPDSLSTDLHALSLKGSAVDLPTTLAKVKACCDLSWLEVIRLATVAPAAYLGHPEWGTLSAGAEADIAVWSLREGEFGFGDTGGGFLPGREKLECEMTFRRGELVWDLNARAARPYETLPEGYGFDPAREAVVPPRKA